MTTTIQKKAQQTACSWHCSSASFCSMPNFGILCSSVLRLVASFFSKIMVTFMGIVVLYLYLMEKQEYLMENVEY